MRRAELDWPRRRVATVRVLGPVRTLYMRDCVGLGSFEVVEVQVSDEDAPRFISPTRLLAEEIQT